MTNSIQSERLYMILGAIFIASLVAGNLIFQKFFSWNFFGIYTFELSVGILPYPITFLITDIISEIYGKRRANQIVIAGLFATLFVLGVVYLADIVQATIWSPVNNEMFHSVFGFTGIAVGASMTAYLLAQFVDIRIYHFWKQKTRGKHLWLRNNLSTMFSQFVDTCSVLILLCLFEVIEWNRFSELLLSGFLFKVLVAAIDTPFLYIAVYSIKKRFQLGINDELTT